ncbi:hypothetical protein O6H91_11G009700 [Diphasiastrum complanatum]|uniref:Uncharacterized protein n=1 Tax=Diphasiastrum complanatum TaxID=34168 RepID=A0ACC2C7E8_DIPCM|nr:hypothetical protein O6H91_Y397800 [Diphasiastrum complanatum]KAJ7537527.1 hypothetical protein O6H91_11G009700 [Diphasiastrum complanatum]
MQSRNMLRAVYWHMSRCIQRPSSCVELAKPFCPKNHRFYSEKAVDGEGKLSLHGVHIFQCPDQLGVVAKISECIASHGANIVNTDLFIDFDGENGPVFHSRSEFAFDPLQWPRAAMEEDAVNLAKLFNAQKSVIRVPGFDPNLKIAVLASAQDHCVVDLMHRWQGGQLPVQLTSVISNHQRGANTHVVRFLERHGIPYHYLPTSKTNNREEEILQIVSSTDFLVLARYMQILTPNFLERYGKDIINIHHGLLPSFRGSNPYKQAFKVGVKLIGATSHFVNEELDGGPIIEQMVDRVSHRDSLPMLAMKSENLEKQCLAKAIQYYCEQRILIYSSNRTIIFN